MDYPKHLSEKIREEVALSYLKHELRKLFPSIDLTDVDNLLINKEMSNPRDFWNGVHGVGMGYKLHIGFIYLVTAENINWSFATFNIKDISFGVERELTRMAESKSVGKIVEYLKNNPNIYKEYQEKFMKSWVDDKTRETDPIILHEKNDGMAVYEGNGRLEKLILDNTFNTSCFVGRYSTNEKKPFNYWLPTSVIMDFLLFVYRAIDEENKALFECQIEMLKNMLRDSDSGKVEFIERALTFNKKYREPILETMGM